MRSLSSFVAFAWLGIGLIGVEASAQQLDPSFGHGGRLSLSMDDVGDGLIQEIPAAVVPTSPEILAVVSTRGSANGNGDARVGVMLRRRNGQVLSCVQTDPDCDRQSNSVSAPVQVPVRAVDAVYVPNWLGPEAADPLDELARQRDAVVDAGVDAAVDAAIDAAASAGPPAGWVDIAALIPDAVLELRYATADNIAGVPLYPVARCWMRAAGAARLRHHGGDRADDTDAKELGADEQRIGEGAGGQIFRAEPAHHDHIGGEQGVLRQLRHDQRPAELEQGAKLATPCQ